MDPSVLALPAIVIASITTFYLVKDGYENPPYTSDTPINFTMLNLTGVLTTTPAVPSLSEVNVKESIACSTAGPGINGSGSNTPFLDYNAQTNVITYQISPGTDPSITYQTRGRMPLFVLAVDVFPGEEVSLSSLSYDIQLASGTTCSDRITLCQTNIAQTIAQPTTDCTYPNFLIGSAIPEPIAGFPNRKKVPVWVATSTAFTWNELDFLMATVASTGIQAPTIEGVKMDATDVRVYLQNSQYRIYAHSKTTTTIAASQTTVNSNNTLFYIVYNGPIFESECAKVQIRFALDPMNTSGTSYGRLSGPPSNSCCKPKFYHPEGGAVPVQWGASPNCTTPACSNITLKVLPSPVNSTNACGTELYLDLFASSTEKTDATGLRFVLKVQSSGSFTFNSTSSVSPYCSNIASCVSVSSISADYLRVVYNVSGLSNLTIDGPTYIGTIALSTLTNGCIFGLTFLDALVTTAGNACIPATESAFLSNNNDDDICALGQQLTMSAATETGQPIAYWNYYINQITTGYYNNSNCKQSGESTGGTKPLCACIPNPNALQNVILTKNDNYGAGVTTYDLVLISKHILGIEPLGSKIKMLAADANGSNSITTADIVQLRKWILGYYTFRLPQANSWRFIDKAFANSDALQNAANPFQAFHERKPYDGIPDGDPDPMLNEVALNLFSLEEFGEFALPPLGLYDTEAEFVGYKIGDVNNSAIPSFDQLPTEDRTAKVLALGTKTVKGQAGTVVEIPVFSTVQQSLSSWQMALNFDTNLLKINSIRWPANLSYGQDRDWNLARAGELRLLWYDATGAVRNAPGTPLFFVQAELLQPVSRSQSLLWSAANSIPQEAYDADYQQYAIHLELANLPILSMPVSPEKIVQPTYRLSAYPNPVSTKFRLEIEASQPAVSHLVLHDLLGREVASQILDLVSGLNVVNMAQLPVLSAGQYIVTLYTPAGVETLRLIKQ